MKNIKEFYPPPYFGRFDFAENGFEGQEKFYIGIHNVIDSGSRDIVVYDWRAPVSSIYYEYELGRAAYQTPKGTAAGEVLLKRQYEIQDGELIYFFDSNLTIDDEILRQALSRTSSVRMRNIVETIQREQNAIIRDTGNELLIVQGAAGSGKTSVALYRIAFLLYHSMNTKLDSNNILIISPNEIFGKYISAVIPELGEENVEESTFDNLSERLLGDKIQFEKRNEYLEALINCKSPDTLNRKKSWTEFKGSREFGQILDRLVLYYGHKLINFEDVYYDGKIIETKQILKNKFIGEKLEWPLAKRLKRLEDIVLDKIHPMQKKRLEKIEKRVQKMEGHDFDIKPFSRLLSIKESGMLMKRLRKFTEIDYMKVYSTLFTEEDLLEKLVQDITLPSGISKLIETTRNNLQTGSIPYEDCAPLMFLKLKLEGSDLFPAIRQVVVDEAQDYSPMQYEVFRLLFRESRFTVLGDIRQSIDKDVELSFYDTVDKILNKRKSIHMFLEKSYRSSYEITAFAQRLYGLQQSGVSFERHEAEPLVICEKSMGSMDAAILESIRGFTGEGYNTIAVICKTVEESRKLYGRFKAYAGINLIDSPDADIKDGVMIIPVYMAKDLEFDAVIVYDVSGENYYGELDRKLLYIACTRALHRLVLFYTGGKSNLLIKDR